IALPRLERCERPSTYRERLLTSYPERLLQGTEEKFGLAGFTCGCMRILRVWLGYGAGRSPVFRVDGEGRNSSRARSARRRIMPASGQITQEPGSVRLNTTVSRVCAGIPRPEGLSCPTRRAQR